MKHQNIIDAVQVGNLRLARRLIDAEIAPHGGRSFDDVIGTVTRVFTGAGELCPPLAFRYKTDVHRAAVGVDEFLLRYDIAVKSSNRVLVIELVCRHVLSVINIAPDDVDAKEHFKIPPPVRALRLLADVGKVVAVIGRQFPNYLDSGLARLIGFEMSGGQIQSP